MLLGAAFTAGGANAVAGRPLVSFPAPLAAGTAARPPTSRTTSVALLERPGCWWSHTATMVAVTTSMIGGAFVAVAVGGLGAGRVPVAVAAAAGVLVTLTAALWRDQARPRMSAADSSAL